MPRDRFEVRSFTLTISCTDQDRSDHFYREILGAARDPNRGDQGLTCPWYRLGNLSLSLMQNAQLRSPASFPEHAVPIFGLDVDDLAAASDHFIASGVEIIEPSDGMRMLIADPDGLLIEVWQMEDDEHRE